MDFRKYNFGNYVILSLFIAGVLFIGIWPSSTTNSLYRFSKNYQCENSNSVPTLVSLDELGVVLEKTKTENMTVIIAIINKAYADQGIKEDTTMLDIFLNSFWLGEDSRPLLDHLLLVAVDQTAYDRCRYLRLNCYKLETEGVDFGGEKIYMSEEFIKMMWARTSFLIEVLKRGYNFIFTDTDVMWLRNPFPKLSKNETEDLQISTDNYNGNPWSTRNPINTGFYFVRSNNKTITLFENWYSMKDTSIGMKEQDVLQDIIHKGIISQLGLRVRFLDTLYFSGFCQNSNDFRLVSTVHANCCRTIVAKVNDLQVVLRDWKTFKKSKNSSDVFRWSDHSGCADSWRH